MIVGIYLVFQLFAIIVFGCIGAQAWYTDKEGLTWCQYNHDSNACSFGVAVGVIGFLGVLLLGASDVVFENLSSIKTRKHIVIADMGFSGKPDNLTRSKSVSLYVALTEVFTAFFEPWFIALIAKCLYQVVFTDRC